jgi:hypothetical protein
MTPIEALYLFPYLASTYPAWEQDATMRFWHALFTNVDDTDALIAISRLAACRQRDISLGDVYIEACRIREDRLAHHLSLDNLNGVRHFRDELPSVVISMLAHQVSCPLCGAARGQTCVFSGNNVPLRSAPVHPVRLMAMERTQLDDVAGSSRTAILPEMSSYYEDDSA